MYVGLMIIQRDVCRWFYYSQETYVKVAGVFWDLVV